MSNTDSKFCAADDSTKKSRLAENLLEESAQAQQSSEQMLFFRKACELVSKAASTANSEDAAGAAAKKAIELINQGIEEKRFDAVKSLGVSVMVAARSRRTKCADQASHAEQPSIDRSTEVIGAIRPPNGGRSKSASGDRSPNSRRPRRPLHRISAYCGDSFLPRSRDSPDSVVNCVSPAFPAICFAIDYIQLYTIPRRDALPPRPLPGSDVW